ncbi:MAG: c-type cytochrome [Bacteroidales bacterium]|nr:c-type cytochrome [Bacteroidales bacterium]
MNYPIWELYGLNSGTLVAIIAVTHAFIAHLAVGGGLFLWLTDLKSVRDNDSDIRLYVQKHTWFFLLLTMVFGGVSGVGIWFIIALASPAATSSLIHNFVFGWAIEWVFFIGEIVALLVYHYRFEKMNSKHRLQVAFLYFLFAWLSMVIINGILAFMLTPGKWLDTGYFWHGFFNPTYFSSLLFRTAAATMIAGLFGYVTVVFLNESEFRRKMLRYCTKWLLFPVPVIILAGIWYYYSVPDSIRFTTFSLNAQSQLIVILFIITSVLVFVTGAFFSLKMNPKYQRVMVFVFLLTGLGWYGSFEYMREYARKPYIIHSYMYSTSVLKNDVEMLNSEGMLAHAKWTEIKEINIDNVLRAGRELFNIQCLACHTIGGVKNDIIKKTKHFTYMGMISHLYGQGKVLNYMPEFVGTPQEMEALAAFIIRDLNKKQMVTEPSHYEPVPADREIPPFDKIKDDYVLLAWNDLGMHCISDCDPWFILLPPANTLEAQLIKRGPSPSLITEGVELRYKVEAGFENPSSHVRFWDFAESYFGIKPEKNIGLSGKGMRGTFDFNADRNSFIAEMIPVVPYKDDGAFNPYPQFIVEAVDIETNETLMTTRVVAPVSTEMGCRNCHGGGWRVNDISGVADETAINILKAHDRLNNTDLYATALQGKPQLCQSCHADPAIGAEGKPAHNNFSAAMHGWHANYMYVEGGNACAMCHPASQKGNTRCNRGIHPQLGYNCTNCHGTLGDHAAGLLNAQTETASSRRLLANLKTQYVATTADVFPRIPWVQQPDCLGCHENFEKPAAGFNAFNKWNSDFSGLYRIRTGDAGIRCAACHNSTHSEYPARNAFGRNLDNAQPMQYNGTPLPIGSEFSCEVCHKQKMEESVHHPNMERMFRNIRLPVKEGLIPER